MSCDELILVAIEPDGRSTCPGCGSVEVLPRPVAFAICGASGSGKSTVVAPLQERLPAHVVIDTDVLLGKWTTDWDAHFELVLRVGSAIAANGRHVVLSASVTPERLDRQPSRDLLGSIVYIALDCAPEERARRLLARPAWRTWDISRVDEANRFAEHLRDVCDLVVDTTDRTVADVADDVAAKILERSQSTPDERI